MCLRRLATQEELSEFTVKREGNHQVGWKEFENDGHGHIQTFLGNSKYLKKDAWLNEKDYRDKSFPVERIQMTHLKIQKSYPTGFHLYLDEDRAWQPARKVYYRKVVAKGWQGGNRVIVAKEIMIPSLKRG